MFAKTASAATYYVRADGTVTAANKANATSPNAVGTSLNMAQVKLATFSAGDQILFSSQGGGYTEVLNLPSGGSDVGTEITYANVPNETPAITTASGSIINTNSKSNVKVIGFSVTYTGVSSSAYGVSIVGTGALNVTISYLTLNMGGNGYGIVSDYNNLNGVYLDHITISNVQSTRNSIYFYGTGHSNFSLTNITIAETSSGVRLKNISGLTIDSYDATGGAGSAMLSIESGSGVLSVSNITANVTSGIVLSLLSSSFGAGSIISDVNITNATNYGIYVYSSSGITIRDSSYSGTGASGYYVLNGSSNINFINDTSDGSGSGGGFNEINSSDISYTDCTAINGKGFLASTSTGGSSNISYLRCHAGSQSQPNVGSGFNVTGAVNGVTYTNCNADYNSALGFVTQNTVSNVTYNYCSASYNGTINVTSDGGAFLPHDSATNIKCYYCIAHHNFNEGFGDVSSGANMVYNAINWANSYVIGDVFRGSTVTTSSVRGNMLFSNINSGTLFKNVISGGSGKPRERRYMGTTYSTTFDYNLFKPVDDNKFVSYDGTNEVSWLTYHATNETHSQNADPLFVNASGLFSVATDFQLSALSPAIDAGTVTPNITATTVDYAGNPIYGTPDIGAYEYQPPHSLIIATPDTIDIGAGARVYADGKFRDLAATNSTVAHLKVTPSGGSFTAYDATTTRPAYLDITGISSWTNAHKTWIENNAQDAGMVTDHSIGDLNSNKYYTISVTGASAANITGINGTTCSNAVCLSSGGGTLSFRYDGGYSAHTFDMVEDTTPPTNVGLSSLTVNSTSQLTILAQTATDASSGLPAAPYWFTESTGNPGGSSSSDWQTSTTFVDSALSSNTLYTYAVKARDANANESAPSSTLSAYTLISSPSGVSWGTIGVNAITLSATGTLTNLASGTSGLYFANNTASTNSGWTQTNSWLSNSLLENTSYTFQATSRNGDSVANTAVDLGSKYTLISSPTGVSWGTIGVNAITLLATGTLANLASGTSGLYFANTTAATNSTWIQTNSWTSGTLAENTQYTFQATSRNGDSVANTAVDLGSKYTLAATPTNLSATAGKTTVTLTVDSLPNDSSGSSGYYFSRTGSNSGWIQVDSWQDINLLCGHIYTYSVIYRNGDGTETTPISIDRQTQGCGSSTSGSGSSGGSSVAADTYTLTFNAPTSNEALTGNDTTIIDYTSTGVGASTVSLFYSLDDGLNWTTLAIGLEPTGTYAWTVPNQTTSQARIRANVYESAGAILTTTESGDFTIVAVAPVTPLTPLTPSTPLTSSTPAGDSLAGITTDVNGRRQAPASTTYGLSPFDGSTELVSTVQAGWLVRSPSYSTVYYIDTNLDRHVFWDAQTYFTWSDSWDDVVWVTDATLPTLSLSSPMLPKPGVVLIKLQSDPAVYKIESDSLTGDYLLRHITSESVAIQMYGSAWADYVLDEDPTMMAHFLRGSAVTGVESVDLSIMKTRAEIAELVR